MLFVDFRTEQDTLCFVFSVQERSGSTYRRPKHTPASAFLYLTFPYPGALTSEFCRKVNLLTEILFLPRPIRKTIMKKIVHVRRIRMLTLGVKNKSSTWI